MLDLYLIRHAESEMNRQNDLVGGRSNSSPLSERGLYQAGLLGQRFLKEHNAFDRVYSSTATRAIQTAETVSGIIHYPLERIVKSDLLLELDQGDWEGVHRRLAYTKAKLEKINANPWEFRAPNGESQRDLEERMLKFLNDEHLLSADQKVAVYTHGLAIKCLLRGIMKSDPGLTYKIVIDNTSITRLRFTRLGWHVLCVNDTAHIYGQDKIEDRHSAESD